MVNLLGLRETETVKSENERVSIAIQNHTSTQFLPVEPILSGGSTV